MKDRLSFSEPDTSKIKNKPDALRRKEELLEKTRFQYSTQDNSVNAEIYEELEKLPLETYNSVLILASEESEEIHDMETTDSESLACLLRIRDIVNRRYQDKGVAESARPRQELISEILDSRTKELVQMMKISEYVMSNALISCALAM